MTTREIETQFILEAPARFRGIISGHDHLVSAGLGQALAVLFGLPLGAPVRVGIRFGENFTLLDVNGHTRREPLPVEVRATLIGAFSALTTVLEGRVHAVDLKGGRQTDA
ncbi:hypothetical protein DEIPH_ctg017orf0225 [Deinococcus phoenicis]|uniref:Uncharacterized protein n=1 Tax=Deinococcus phoenicis TaxID=1476583 RepID=A0A016QSG5_9DEIO|nr:hypothetical protein [Deinococcus phoenicis]EYB68847.1 hypothetical protein DEIPH_ctg017orf0225 [Deinococcus phoenicis]